jgi:lantibiotic modifying enzyme
MQNQVFWKPALDPSLCDRVLSMVSVLARRLASPEAVMAITREQEPIFWTDTAFAGGFPSLALLFFALAKSTHDSAWLDIANTYLSLAGGATQRQPLDSPGLARGSSGFAALLASSADVERSQQALGQLERKLSKQILHTVWWKSVADVEVFQYDAISGAAGVVAALCCHQVKDPLVHTALFLLLHHLVHFAESASLHEPNAWSIPASLMESHRHGEDAVALVNCGLAHGVPGPLAALSIALLSGHQIHGQPEAIHHLAYWLAEHHVDAAWGIDWPDVIAVGTSLEDVRRLAPARSGWCYGAPGVIRALWLAGTALHDSFLQERALQGLEALLRRPAHTRRIDSLTLCHGLAGLLLLFLRFLHETQDSCLQACIPSLVEQIVARFDPDLPFGFRYTFKPGTVVDSLGLLIGVSGTLLALLAASTDEEPGWDRALLLS